MPVSIYIYHGRHLAGWYYLVCLPDCLPVLGVVFSVAYTLRTTLNIPMTMSAYIQVFSHLIFVALANQIAGKS